MCTTGALYVGDPSKDTLALHDSGRGPLEPAVMGDWLTKVRVVDGILESMTSWADDSVEDSSVGFDTAILVGDLEVLRQVDTTVDMIGIFDAASYPVSGDTEHLCDGVCAGNVRACNALGREGGLVVSREAGAWGAVHTAYGGSWEVAVQRDPTGEICAVVIRRGPEQPSPPPSQ